MPAYAVANANIAHQRIEDEVIVINLITGAYFSLRASAADAWELLIGGTDTEIAAASLAGRYGGDPASVRHDLDRFVAALLDEGLIDDGPAAATPIELPDIMHAVPYGGLALEKFDDMEELLLLDPIHEVDEAGWPVVATEPTET